MKDYRMWKIILMGTTINLTYLKLVYLDELQHEHFPLFLFLK
jgi:hypothetical protein